MGKYKDLSEKTIEANPFIQFEIWYRKHKISAADEPSSVSLGTASENGSVSVRTVLLKDYSEEGFVFFTNYESKKALQLKSNNNAALLFYWPESGRQIRIEGKVEKVSQKISVDYHNSRPRGSRLSAWASRQSTVIPGREYLEDQYHYYKKKFYKHPVDKPPYWGGYRIIPRWFEFWQSGRFRLHDRISYSLKNGIWIIDRLAP
jgi:pyridoxamine 5'-phosphate oxidase